MLNDNFRKIFGDTPVVGMLHLGGGDVVERVVEELDIFESEGVDGVIVENYHGSLDDVVRVLRVLSFGKKRNVRVGVNVLPNRFDVAFSLVGKYGVEFIQLDYVAGTYTRGALNVVEYARCKEQFPEVVVFGGVWPKYYSPVVGSVLEDDVREGMARVEAVVVTGSGTGQETPAEKIGRFRAVLGRHPLIVGAGLTPENAYAQLCVADGAIVGSCFKEGNDTLRPVDAVRVRAFMEVVREVRAYKSSFK